MATANGSSVTIDESTGLQNALTSTPSGDADDNDTSLTLPSIFSSWLAAFTSRPPVQVALSGYDGSNTGTAAITFSGSSIGFSTSTGTPLNGVDSGMTTTAGNEPILLFTDTTNDNILYGKTSDGTLVFAAYLDEMGGTTLTGAKLWMVEYEAIRHPDSTDPDDVLNLANLVYVTVQENLKFSLENAPSGQNLFLMLGNESAGVVVTGKNPANQSTGASIIKGDTINTSQGGGTTTIGVNNQMIDAKGKEGIYLTFVKTPTTNFTIPNLDQNEADVESNISFNGLNNVKNSSFQVVQLQGGKAATVTISAFSASTASNISGVNYVDNLTNNTAVGITAVVVKDASGTVIAPSSSLIVNISGGIATVVGIQAGYTIEYQTSADHNRVLIENTGSGSNMASFDIGGFSIGSSSQSTLEIGSLMRFEDGGPALTVALTSNAVPVLTTEDAETIGNLTDSATDNFSNAFTANSNYGADGEGLTRWEYALSVSADNDADLSSNGTAIHLYLIDRKVVGSTATNSIEVTDTNTVFDVSVDDNGQLTLHQFAEIDHEMPGTDTSTNLGDQTATMLANKITLNAKAIITDGDGDTATSTQSLDIGDKLAFADDGPWVIAGAMGTAPVLTTQDAETIGDLTDSAAEDFSGVFTANANYGADGAGSTSWQYALSVNSANDTGLSRNGTPIYLYLIDGTVVGSTATSAAEVTDTNTVFDVSVNAIGRVTLQQFAEIDHATHGTSTNFDNQTAMMVANKITLSATATVTDGDGDTATSTQSLGIGNKLAFADDGPAVTAGPLSTVPVLTTRDAETIGTDTDVATADFSSVFVTTTDFGADGGGTVSSTYALSVNSDNDAGLSSNGADIYLYLINGKVVGSTAMDANEISDTNTVFDVSVENSGQVTLRQLAEIDHALSGTDADFANQTAKMLANKITLSATATITDGDGDTATSTQSLGIGDKLAFADDGPWVIAGAMGTAPVLTTQDAETISELTDSAVADFASVFTVNTNYGADGEGSTSWTYALSVDSANDAGLSSNGADIYLYLINGKVIGSTAMDANEISDTNTVFDVRVENSGQVTLRQLAEIDHALSGTDAGFANQTAKMLANKITLSATATITDGDGDTATSIQSLNIGDKLAFADDGPAVISIEDLSGTNNGEPIVGSYNFAMGADAVGDEETDGIVLKTLTGTTGGGRAIEHTVVTWAAESSTSVAYNFSFNYYSGPDAMTLQSATGLVTFDKAADGTLGDFTFDMDGLIGGETTFSTSAVQLSYNYDTLGNNSPEIVVQKYSDDFYGVFSAFVPFKPSDSNGLTTVGINNVKNATFVEDDVFSSQQPAYLNIATNTVGVNSDTLQSGELLNLDFYTSNPVIGATSPPASPSASINTATEKFYADTIKITLNQITDGEDIAVLLKLYNEATSSFTTRLIIANSALDYVTVGSDKVVTIGPEDYNDGYRIYGLQVLTSTENVTGTGYSLKDGSEVTLTSAGRDYQDTSDSDVIKIIKIEVVTETTSTYDVDLNFAGAVVDDDADFANFNFDVHLEMDGLNLVGTTTAPMDFMA